MTMKTAHLKHNVLHNGTFTMGDGTPVDYDDIACALRNPKKRNGIYGYREYGEYECDSTWEGDSREHARRIVYIIRHWDEQYPIEVGIDENDQPGVADGCHRLCAAIYMGLDNIEVNHCCEEETGE